MNGDGGCEACAVPLVVSAERRVDQRKPLRRATQGSSSPETANRSNISIAGEKASVAEIWE